MHSHECCSFVDAICRSDLGFGTKVEILKSAAVARRHYRFFCCICLLVRCWTPLATQRTAAVSLMAAAGNLRRAGRTLQWTIP